MTGAGDGKAGQGRMCTWGASVCITLALLHPRVGLCVDDSIWLTLHFLPCILKVPLTPQPR